MSVNGADPKDLRIAELEARLAAALQRIQELEARLGLNSTNSSKPPSSDPPNAPKRPSKPKKKAKRKRGGQPGHKRHERKLVPLDQVDKVTSVKPSHCGRCSHGLDGHDPDPIRHQIVELPKIKPTVTEFQLHGLNCENCGATTRATLPDGVPRGNFGPRLQAFASVASGYYRLPKRMVKALLADAFGIELSVGSISKLEKKTSAVLSHPAAEVHDYVRQAAVTHADETGWKENKHKAWLWLAGTAQAAVALIRPTRSMEAAKELLGDFQGCMVSDRYSSYGFIPAEKRQVCWAHLLRDIEAFRLHGRGASRLASQIQKPARELIHLCNRVREGTLEWGEFRSKAKELKLEILFHLRRGAGWREAAIAGVCTAILKFEKALFQFVDREDVPPTNNHAEQLLRHAVIWRKTSYGTDSACGSRFCERILTTVMTLRLQGRNVLDYVTAACRAALNDEPLPSLLPATSSTLTGAAHAA